MISCPCNDSFSIKWSDLYCSYIIYRLIKWLVSEQSQVIILKNIQCICSVVKKKQSALCSSWLQLLMKDQDLMQLPESDKMSIALILDEIWGHFSVFNGMYFFYTWRDNFHACIIVNTSASLSLNLTLGTYTCTWYLYCLGYIFVWIFSFVNCTDLKAQPHISDAIHHLNITFRFFPSFLLTSFHFLSPLDNEEFLHLTSAMCKSVYIFINISILCQLLWEAADVDMAWKDFLTLLLWEKFSQWIKC